MDKEIKKTDWEEKFNKEFPREKGCFWTPNIKKIIEFIKFSVYFPAYREGVVDGEKNICKDPTSEKLAGALENLLNTTVMTEYNGIHFKNGREALEDYEKQKV